MANLVKIASKSEIPRGGIKEVNINGKVLAIANSDGEYFAFDGICTHAQCSLAGGFLDGYTLTCYCHGAQFDISTGEVLAPPAPAPVHIYNIEVQGDDLLVELGK